MLHNIYLFRKQNHMSNPILYPKVANRYEISCEYPFFNIEILRDAGAFQINSLKTNKQYRVLFLNRGGIEYFVGKRKVSIEDLKIGVIKPKHSVLLSKRPLTNGYMISFSHDFLQLSTGSSTLLQSVFYNLGEEDHLLVPRSEHRFLKDIIERMIYERNTESSMKAEVVKGLFHVFASFLNRASSRLNPLSQGKYHRQTKRFFFLLEQNYAALKMPADYAKLLAVTPAYLNSILKDTLGNSTRYFIQQRILLEAKRLMTNNELNMKEVAYKLGFFDVSHFSKFFKRIAGQRFTDFKRTIAA
jgi:AraC family transcriptional activator of pobA